VSLRALGALDFEGIGKLGWPLEKGRDGERTPMQWNGSSGAGFTTSPKPWLPIPSSAASYNVATEERNADSILNTYRRLLALRQSEPALRNGTYQAINEDNPKVFAYVRKSGASTILVALNMSAEARTMTVNLDHAFTAKPLYGSPEASTEAIELNHLSLPPFGVVVATVR
jgi:alpha-glucosidase